MKLIKLIMSDNGLSMHLQAIHHIVPRMHKRSPNPQDLQRQPQRESAQRYDNATSSTWPDPDPDPQLKRASFTLRPFSQTGASKRIDIQGS